MNDNRAEPEGDDSSEPRIGLWTTLCLFEIAWMEGRRPLAEEFVAQRSASERAELIPHLLAREVELRAEAGNPPTYEELAARFPDDPTLVNRVLRDGLGSGKVNDVSDQTADSPATDDLLPEVPPKLGRYRDLRQIGAGGFGIVYRAEDIDLGRSVAIKVPREECWGASQASSESYITEARVLAGLDHPNIVPVFDFGRTDDGRPFVVSKYIEGENLAELLRRRRPTFVESARLIATIADALHYAHLQRLVHRDVKPSNILVDVTGRAYLADFGMVLREHEFGRGPTFAGTVAYMSPEQARFEGHRVDGRSDIFSLGIVLYEMLTGRRPFCADAEQDLLSQLIEVEARPLRQINDTIPRGLERICLKALSKRATDRYTTAKDFAEDLRLETDATPAAVPAPAEAAQKPSAMASAGVNESPAPTPSRRDSAVTESSPIRIVPKGLRSFDAHDADFFLELLPGPRDRDGMPDSIRFWKTRIEETDSDCTFPVGLIYGPSGCGKSSFIKAGLIPRLSADVTTIYIEATAKETESRLLSALQKRFDGLAETAPRLNDAVAALRRGSGAKPGTKVLIVIDQFEQWLHAKHDPANSELVLALRQCDGARVQCIVTVRDDFWLAVSRFLRHLEVRLIEGHNSALADLFDSAHAKKVLAAFGRAFGKLPTYPVDPGKETQAFLKQAVAGLAQDGKIVSVRLALFAEMMKSKEWTLPSLLNVGGTAGVGVTFLEETFSASTSPPEHRYHQNAARAVLKAFLPDTGANIKGQMRSTAELLSASGYENRVSDFEDLMRILDQELRLVTPTDPEGKEGPESAAPDGAQQKYYQLTHDYLVPSLREWLTRKQKETPQGRAELLLADRAGVWSARPENRQLPSLWQWWRIRRWTKRQNWTLPQRKMMAKATRYHSLRVWSCAAVFIITGLVGWELTGRSQANSLRAKLLAYPTAEVPKIIEEMGPYRRWMDPQLRQIVAAAPFDSRDRLHAAMALLPIDQEQVGYVKDRYLKCEPRDVSAIQSLLGRYRHVLIPSFWATLESDSSDADAQLRAAAALAYFEPGDLRWNAVSSKTVALLIAQPSHEIGIWIEAFRPIKSRLAIPLIGVLEDERQSDAVRSLATVLFRIYGQDDAEAWAELSRRVRIETIPTLTLEERQECERTRANIVVALLQMNELARAEPVLAQVADPTARTYLIHKLNSGRVSAEWLRSRFMDLSLPAAVRAALILAGGQFRTDLLLDRDRESIFSALESCLRDRDSGVRAAADWLLRFWGENGRVDSIIAKLKDEDAPVASSSKPHPDGRSWFVNSACQVLVIVPAGQVVVENQNRSRTLKIPSRFAIASHETTLGLFLKFRKEHRLNARHAPAEDCPALGVNWYEAAEFCNWLSKKDRIPEKEWCYRPNREGMYGSGMGIVPNARQLRGYRLPLEVEWEYACRAGSTTDAHFGADEELAIKYAWFTLNSNSRSHRVGLLKPNALGLFDMYGNAAEWCQVEQANPKRDLPADGGEVVFVVNDQVPQPLRPSSFLRNLEVLNSDSRTPALPSGTIFEVGGSFTYLGNCGFRVVRTMP